MTFRTLRRASATRFRRLHASPRRHGEREYRPLGASPVGNVHAVILAGPLEPCHQGRPLVTTLGSCRVRQRGAETVDVLPLAHHASRTSAASGRSAIMPYAGGARLPRCPAPRAQRLRTHPQPPGDRRDRRIPRRVIAGMHAHQPDIALALVSRSYLTGANVPSFPKVENVHEIRDVPSQSIGRDRVACATACGPVAGPLLAGFACLAMKGGR
jgi:hypothetical protein